jgi:hypothetical protein
MVDSEVNEVDGGLTGISSRQLSLWIKHAWHGACQRRQPCNLGVGLHEETGGYQHTLQMVIKGGRAARE